MAGQLVDLLIIGGGVNGAGIARDAAGRGLDVVLCEMGDLGSATSSASTKLIHGGLRYLEYMEFRLVRESLIEREVLLRAAPHIIRPMRFVLPHHRGLRPASVLRLGLFIYDHLGGREMLPGTRTLRLAHDPAGVVLQPQYTKGFEYSDCWVEDARLVVLNALDAAEHGARVLTRTRCQAARRVDGVWEAVLGGADGAEERVRARALVNAAGPWVDEVLALVPGVRRRDRAVRLVKGSHMVTRRLFAGDRAFIFQSSDGRVGFAIPFERNFTLIGTTDVPHDAPPGPVTASQQEIAYLCELVNAYLASPITPADVLWSYAGVRPLYDDAAPDASAVTRDYVLQLDHPAGAAPLVTVYGGKITTFRRLAEHVLEQLLDTLARDAPAWTERAPLPGGDMPAGDFEAYRRRMGQRYPWVPPQMLLRLLRAYGTRAQQFLFEAGSLDALGEHFGGGLYEAELDYLARREWARSALDVLWRRSKLGLHLSDESQRRVARWFGSDDVTPVSWQRHAAPTSTSAG